MESYKVLVRESAVRELEGLSKKDLARLVGRIQRLSVQPRPRGCEKLSAQERYRIRQGDYRIVYSVDDETREVIVVKIGHRSEIYRR
jgi:mRNA interferase RelE/StbE